ncbi:MAG: esterase-like activity of phytase family protein [Paracoccaceae bacterium]
MTSAVVLALGLQGSAAPTQPAGFLTAFLWSGDDIRLGGMSGIDLSPDGLRFVALSDRGAITEGRLIRDANGQITGIDAPPLHLLKGEAEAPLNRARADSEGLAWADDGTIYISFEGVARVLRYDAIDGSAINLPRPDAFRRMQENASLEALAIDRQGRLFTLPERSGAEDRPFPVYVYDGQWSQPYSIPRQGDFLPVGADFGPDGRYYLLERNFLGLRGFASRVRVFALGPTGFDAGQVVLETAPGTRDNLEGLSVWQDDQGRIRLTMVSDDNFIFYLRNEIVEYAIPVDGALGAD